jgi:hypothetical protein
MQTGDVGRADRRRHRRGDGRRRREERDRLCQLRTVVSDQETDRHRGCRSRRYARTAHRVTTTRRKPVAADRWRIGAHGLSARRRRSFLRRPLSPACRQPPRSLHRRGVEGSGRHHRSTFRASRSVALAWWRGAYPNAGGHGVLTVYDGNRRTISAFDPTRGGWLARRARRRPEAARAASRRQRLQREAQLSRLRWRQRFATAPIRLSARSGGSDANLRQTRMPDAPHPLGTQGMKLVERTARAATSSRWVPGEAWELDPSGAGAWEQMFGPSAPHRRHCPSPNVVPPTLLSDATSARTASMVYVERWRRAPADVPDVGVEVRLRRARTNDRILAAIPRGNAGGRGS